MRGPNWMTAILLIIMAVAFIAALSWIVRANIQRRKRDAELASTHEPFDGA